MDRSQLIITHLYRDDSKTAKITIPSPEIRDTVKSVYDILKDNGFDPIRQIIGYLISEDPAYIPDYDNARVLLSKIDRDLLLSELLKSYIGVEEDENDDE